MNHARRTLRSLIGLTGLVGLIALLLPLGSPREGAADDKAKPKTKLETAKRWDIDIGTGRPSGNLPPVGDQGLSETCSAWAVRSAAAFQRRRLSTTPNAAPSLSMPANRPCVTFLYNYARRVTAATGTTAFALQPLDLELTQVLCAVRRLGVPSDAVTFLGLDAQDAPPAPFHGDATAEATDEMFRDALANQSTWLDAINYRPIDVLTPEAVRDALDAGPVIAMISVPDDFGCGVGEFYCRRRGSQFLGSHFLVIVGYDPNRRPPPDTAASPRCDADPTGHAFLLMNSWGTFWGRDGFTWVDERTLMFGRADRREARLLTAAHRFAGRVVDSPDASDVCQVRRVRIMDFPRSETRWKPDPARLSCESIPPLQPLHPKPRPPPDSPNPGVPLPPTDAMPRTTLTYDRPVHGLLARPLVIRSPRIPLVACLLGAKVSFTFRHPDGVDDGVKIDSTKSEFELLTPRSDSDATTEEKHGLGADLVGHDVRTIGAFVEQAVFRRNEQIPSSTGPREFFVDVEVRYPGDPTVRSVALYRVRVTGAAK